MKTRPIRCNLPQRRRVRFRINHRKTQYASIGRPAQPEGRARQAHELARSGTVSLSHEQIPTVGVNDRLSVGRPASVVTKHVSQPAA